MAAELIVATIVGSFAKLGKHLEGWYDLMAAVDKLGHVFGPPCRTGRRVGRVARQGAGRLAGAPSSEGCRQGRRWRGVAPPGCLLAPAGRMTVIGSDGHGASARLTDPLSAFGHNPEWSIEIDGVSVDDLQPNVLRSQVTVVRSVEILDASLAENIHLHRREVRDADVVWALEVAGLTDELAEAGVSLATRLPAHGWPLNESQQRRLMLARALAGRPRLLVLDHLLDALADEELDRLVSDLEAACGEFTILVITGRSRPRERHPNAFVLRKGIAEGHRASAAMNGHAAAAHH